MGNSYGMYSLNDLLAVRNASAATFGLDLINQTIQNEVAYANARVDEMLADFAQPFSTQCTIANLTSFEGICLSNAAAGEAVTLFGIGSKIYITATDQTIGTFWYVSASAGLLYDTKVATADTYYPVGKMITANVLEITRSGL